MIDEEPRLPVVLTPRGPIVVFGDTYAEIGRLARKIAFQVRRTDRLGGLPPNRRNRNAKDARGTASGWIRTLRRGRRSEFAGMGVI